MRYTIEYSVDRTSIQRDLRVQCHRRGQIAVTVPVGREHFGNFYSLNNIFRAFAPAAPCFHSCPISQLGSLIEDFLPVMSLICNLGDQNYPGMDFGVSCILSRSYQVIVLSGTTNSLSVGLSNVFSS